MLGRKRENGFVWLPETKKNVYKEERRRKKGRVGKKTKDAFRTWEEGVAWKTALDVEHIYFATYGLKGYYYLALRIWRSRKGQKRRFSNGPLRRENSSTHMHPPDDVGSQQ